MVSYILSLIKVPCSHIDQAFRALGQLLGGARDYMVLTGIHGDLVNFKEKAQFDTQG